uniref:Collagen type VI alpha 1 chain n=1 Tax=Oncorhynchus kisutch TaxID=8019 RepID=A0A8C7IRG2_ONCKI
WRPLCFWGPSMLQKCFGALPQICASTQSCLRCPVDLFFVLDTSESVALRAKPPNFYIDQIKSFTERFIMELKEMRHPCDRSLTWNSGALHYSDEIILVRQLSDIATERQALISDIKGISYIGKGTHTDCAIKRGIAELLIGGSHYQENKYIVVVTDGHPLTGYKEPCGGLQEAANEARQHGVKVFSVAISPDQEDTRLSVIATDQNYRQNFTAADNSRSTQLQTIRSIIDMIVRITPLPPHTFPLLSISLLLSPPLFISSFPLLYLYLSSFPLLYLYLSSFPLLYLYLSSFPLLYLYLSSFPLLYLYLSSFPLLYLYLSSSPLRGIGNKGERGHKGYKGDKGQQGTDGVDGRKGDPGFPGLAGCKGSPGPDVSPPPKCKCGPLDLAFIVDSSESIGSTNFALAKDFIITVIDRLIKDQQVNFGFNESRVGVVQYSGDGAQEAVRLGDPNINTLTELKQAVRDLRWLAEATYTGEALQFSLTNMIDRLQQENRVVLVLTDGRSDITRDKTPLNTLCGKGIKVGGLGVKDYSGRQPNHEQLSAVVCTSDPKPGFSFVLENFAELLDDSFLQNLTTRICEDKKCPNYKCPISFSGDTDIVLMMDSSASVGQRNFDSSKTFVKRLAERFLSAERSGRAAVRVAVGQYSRERRMEAELTSNLTLLTSKIEAATFQNDGTDVTKAMAFAMEKFQTSGGGNRKRKLVLFSDGRSQGVTEAMLEKRVRLVSEGGVELYVITVGNQVSEANLRSLVSRGRSYDVTYAQRHLFRVPDYPSLLRGVFYQTVSRRVSQA